MNNLIYKFFKSLQNVIIKTFFFLQKKIFRQKVFIYKNKYRSDSDNGDYISTILDILKNQYKFNNFKRNYFYKKIIEHVSVEQGQLYLNLLLQRNDDTLEKAIKTALISDDLGNPEKFLYDTCNFPLSPTTLRYVKVASDLKNMFGKKIGNIAEIGCGYGGQALVNDQLLDLKFVKLFDLPIVNELIDRYLNANIFRSAYKTTTINNEIASEYDLVMSNYAFSELPRELQIIYIDKVISKSKKGYLTMNSGLSGTRSIGKLSLADLREQLPKFEVFEEEPLTSPHNYIIAWGYNEDKIQKNFILKKL